MVDIRSGSFVWSYEREQANLRKHGVGFVDATRAFRDPAQKIFIDTKHSHWEGRFFCVGKVRDRVLTVRFTYRRNMIRIFGAGYWRKGRAYYEKKTQIT